MLLSLSPRGTKDHERASSACRFKFLFLFAVSMFHDEIEVSFDKSCSTLKRLAKVKDLRDGTVLVVRSAFSAALGPPAEELPKLMPKAKGKAPL